MAERNRRFSERIGEVLMALQVRSMNDSLRSSIWNLIRVVIPPDNQGPYGVVQSAQAVETLTVHILRVPAEKIDPGAPRWWLYSRVLEMTWHQVYDLLEAVADNADVLSGGLVNPNDIRAQANHLLEAENAAYRFVGGELVEITSPTEADAIQESLQQAEAHGLTPVRDHLQQSLELLGKRPEPDYRNAIKEAISAVESAAKLIAKEKKGTLDDALDLLAQRLSLHGALKSSLSKLYGFTSDSSGIRHALLDTPTVDASDARFFVVACAAFVSWLITKADAAGLLKRP